MKIDTDISLIEAFLFFLTSEKGLASNTIISYGLDLRQFSEFCMSLKKGFSEVTYFDVLSFFEAAVLANKIEVSSQLRKISALFNFYEFLIKEKGFLCNPFQEIERPSKNENLPIFLDKEETQRLLQFAKNEKTNINSIRNYAILELLYSSGMRITECLSIELKHILNSEHAIKNDVIIMGKGQKERLIFVNKSAREALFEYLKVRKLFSRKESPFLFNANSKTGTLSRQSFFYHLRQISHLAGIDATKVSPHKIRHSFATHLFLNGIDIRILQEMLGHADISTTEIYTHINSASLKSTVEKFHPLSSVMY